MPWVTRAPAPIMQFLPILAPFNTMAPLIDAMLKPGQFIDLLLAVQEINGFSSDMDELRDEAKN